MTTDISICSTALILVGANEITSFEDETREAKVCAAIYENTKNDMLSSHPWKFAAKQAPGEQLVDTPVYGYTYMYQLPADCISVRSIESGSPYEVFEDRLYCNDDSINLKYTYNVDENAMPPYFVQALVFEMASQLALALGEDMSKSQLYSAKMGAQLIKARRIDSQQQPNGQLRQGNFLLTQARL